MDCGIAAAQTGEVQRRAAASAERREITLRYSIGDLCLFRIGFNALVERSVFDPAAPPITAVPEGAEILPDGVDASVRLGVRLERRLPALHRRKNGLWYIRNQSSNHYIDLCRPFEEYLKEFSSKTRSTLGRKVRKAGGFEFRAYREASEVAEFHRLSRDVAVKTYQEKMFGAIPGSSEFLTRAIAMAEDDRLRGFLLLDQGKPISYLYLPAEDGVLTYGYLGYDPDYAAFSIGTVVLYRALEELFAERRFRYFDFTCGEGQHKTLFGRESVISGDLYFFRRNLRNSVAVYGHAAMDRFSGALGRTLQAIGIRGKVKKLLRAI